MEPQHLSRPPIAEAVIEFRFPAPSKWEPERLKESLSKELAFFSKKIEEGQEFVFRVSLDGTQSKEDKLGLIGYRIISKDEKFIVQFNKSSFVFSQVKEYQRWDHFSSEARKLFGFYEQLLQPREVSRVGVRFINQMDIQTNPFHLSSFFNDPPNEKQIDNWTLGMFLHRDTLKVPNSPYFVNIIKTVLAPISNEGYGKVILDIDVSMQKGVICSWEELGEHLNRMRDIKDKTFFSIVPDEKLKEYL